ncbi:MAG: hypothetical protein V1674_03530 [Candidatus Omnitrophota bacterium]
MNLGNFKQIKLEELIKKPVFLFHIGIVIFSFIVAKHVYTDQIKKAQDIKIEIGEEKEDNLVISKIEDIKKNLEDYKKVALLDKDMGLVINMINQYANQIGIKFESMSPLAVKEIGPYFYLSVNLRFQIDSFNQLGSFISIIENSSLFLQVDGMSVANVSYGREDQQAARSCDLIVGAFYFK